MQVGNERRVTVTRPAYSGLGLGLLPKGSVHVDDRYAPPWMHCVGRARPGLHQGVKKVEAWGLRLRNVGTAFRDAANVKG